MIAIEKGVPVPEVVGPRGGGYTKYPFAGMKVGDSFFVPADKPHRIRSAASHYGRKHGKQFTCGERQENGQRVVRVWRVE